MIYENIMRPNIMHRPVWRPSKHNTDTVDTQYDIDKELFNRTAHKYREHASKQYHHSRPIDQGDCVWADGNIVDKGRSHPQDQTAVFDPIIGKWREVHKDTQRPSSAPAAAHPRDDNAEIPVPRGRGRGVRWMYGQYNPLTHHYIQGPDPSHDAVRQREDARARGLDGIRTRPDVQETYNVFRGDFTDPAVGAARSEAEHRPAVTKHANGQSWGTYNPVTNQWLVEPQDPKRADVQTLAVRQLGLSAGGVRRVPLPKTQGVYDPIKNMWIEPPQCARAYHGQTFAPRVPEKRDAGAKEQVPRR